MDNIKFLNQDQVKLLLDDIKSIKHKCIVLLMLDAGLRVTECLSLRFRDFDFKNESVIVNTSKKRNDHVVTRTVPLSNRCTRRWHLYCNLFLSYW